MTPDQEWLVFLWEAGLRSEGIGPIKEWHPVGPIAHRLRHDAFWRSISGIIPDDECDEPYWMTPEASQDLLNNYN